MNSSWKNVSRKSISAGPAAVHQARTAASRETHGRRGTATPLHRPVIAGVSMGKSATLAFAELQSPFAQPRSHRERSVLLADRGPPRRERFLATGVSRIPEVKSF